jgi:hypothetical protein
MREENQPRLKRKPRDYKQKVSPFAKGLRGRRGHRGQGGFADQCFCGGVTIKAGAVIKKLEFHHLRNQDHVR